MPTSTSVKSGAHRLGPGIADAARSAARRRWRGTSARAPAAPAPARPRHRPSSGRRGTAGRDGPTGSTRWRFSAEWAVVSQRRIVRSRPPEKATASSTTTIFWCCELPKGTELSMQSVTRSGVRQPSDRRGKQLALAGIEQRIVPQQEMDVQVGPRPHQIAQEVGEIAGQAVGRAAVGADELRAAVDVPADHHDAALGLQASAAHRLEEGGSVDQDGGPGGPLDPPDIVVRPQEIHRPSTCGQANGCAMHLTPPRRPGEAIVEGALRNREGRWAKWLTRSCCWGRPTGRCWPRKCCSAAIPSISSACRPRPT